MLLILGIKLNLQRMLTCQMSLKLFIQFLVLKIQQQGICERNPSKLFISKKKDNLENVCQK